MIGSEPLAATQAMAISGGADHPPAKPFAPTCLALAIFAGQHAAPKRRPGYNAEAKRLAGRQKLLLGRAFDETVLDLKTGDGRNAAQFGDGCRPRHAPSGKVREAGVENLAGPGEVIEAPHDLVEGCDAIGYVRPVEVDPIGLEPLETRLNRRNHGSAAIARDEDAGLRVRLKGEFRGPHKLVPPPG